MTPQAIIDRYNAAAPGTRFEAHVAELGPGLRMWLLEAGARHTASRDGEGWRLVVERRASPAQGTIPGLHHLVSQGESLWVAERAERVARVDLESRRVVARRAVARKASHVALKNGRLFVADPGANEMIALRAADLAELARWPAPGMPQLPLASDEGIVCVTGGATGTVTLARPRGGGYEAQTVPVGAAPHDPCLDAAGEHLFVPCAGESAIVKLRLADGAVLGRARVGDGPSHLARHPDGSRLYSANSWEGTVSCLSAEGQPLGSAPSGGWAHAIDISPDGTLLYVANFFDDTLAVFDAATLERRATLATEAYAHGLDVSPDGRHVVTTGFCSPRLRVFDSRTRAQSSIEVGLGSSHTAFAADGAAWVACSVADHLARIDLGTLGSEIVALS
ncbi:MAG TPA: beta-propeller fold lactonase family protein [Burkholderiales bacterium]